MRVEVAQLPELGESTAEAARTLSHLLGYHDTAATEPVAMRRPKAEGRGSATAKAAP